MSSDLMVFRSNEVECLYKCRGSDTLLVTFNEMGMSANGRDIWGDAPAKSLNLSIFGFVSTKPNWFPIEDFLCCLKYYWKWTLNSKHRRVVVFGLSQGGYAALKFHKMLGADISISFSPQISINPEDIIDYRFNKFYDSTKNISMRITRKDMTDRCYIIYDPYDKNDARHVESLALTGNATAISLPFVGHGSIRAFLGKRNLWRLLEACFDNNIKEIRAIYVETKHSLKDRPLLVATEAARRHPKIALEIFEKYGRISNDIRWMHICWAISAKGFSSSIIDWAQDRLQENPKNDYILESLCMIKIYSKNKTAAVRMAQDLYDESPLNQKRQYILNLAKAME